MRLKTRLLLLLVPAITVTLIVLTAISYRNARWQSEELAEKTAQNIALEQSDKVLSVMRSAEAAARSLAFAMSELKDSKNVDRDSMRQITRGFAASSTNYYGVWTLWEPNAYDGKDDEFKGSEEYGNKEGRANAYWTCVDSCLLYDPSDNYDHEEYYKVPKERKKLTTVAPYRDMDTTDQVLMTTVAMPIISSGGQKVLGVVGVDIELEFIHELLAGVKPFNTGYAMLVSDEGAIVAQPDVKGQKRAKEASLPKVSDDILQKIRKGEAFTAETVDKDTGEVFSCFYTPLMADGFSSPWFFMVALPMDEVMAQSRQELLILLGISVLALLVLIWLVFYTANGVARPLQRIGAYASSIADGKYDTKEGEADSVFEIAELQSSLKTMLDSLLKSMGEAQQRTAEAATEAARAREAVTEADKARLVSEERHQAMVKIAERVDAVSQRLQDTSVHLSQSIAVAGNESQEQNSLMAETVTAISGMSDSISRVSANTQDTARFSEETGVKARQGAEVVNATIAAFDSIREETDALSVQIEDLSKRTEGIGSILAIINDIADQTNLLALNAAIEAARAGEYGRGFAVVADEVRKLAEKTMQATQEVGQSVAGIRQSMRVSADSVGRASKTVHDTVTLGHEARTSLEDIVNLVGRMNDQIQDIAGLCQEQDQLGNQVAGIVDRLRQLSIVVSDAMEQGAEITRSLEPQARELGVLVDQLSNN